jgi:hypothetical protein
MKFYTAPDNKVLEISHNVRLTNSPYLEYLSLEYVEYSTDYWSSDTTTDVDIDREKAKEIIAFLEEKFQLNKLFRPIQKEEDYII